MALQPTLTTGDGFVLSRTRTRSPGVRSVARAAALLGVLVLAAITTPAAAQDVAPVGSTAGGTRFECPGCLVPVDPSAARCPECGVSFKKIEYECPKCKATVPYDAPRCSGCGLAFDAPTPGRREKRTAVERSMPAVRDFLRATPPAPEEGVEVHGRSSTGFRHGRETSFDGTTTIDRGYEDLSLDVLRIGIPELSFHGDLELLADPNLRPRGRVALDLREAFFRYENREATTQIQLGRQLVTCGVAREFVDGVFLHQLVGDRLGLEVFGGHPVATDKSSPDGDWALGGRIFYRGLPKTVARALRDMTIGFSFLGETWGWQRVKEYLGFDFSISPTWSYDVSGHVYLDMLAGSVSDARLTFNGRPMSFVQVTADYHYVIPSTLLPKSSIFWVFASDERHELELDLDFCLGERLKLQGRARLIHVVNPSYTTEESNVLIDQGDDDPVELGAGIAYRHGEKLRSVAGIDASVLYDKGMHRYEGATVRMASILQLRGYEMLVVEVADRHFLRASADLHLEAYDGGIYAARNVAFAATLTGGYSYDERYTGTVGGDYRTTPDFKGTGDVFVKLEVRF